MNEEVTYEPTETETVANNVFRQKYRDLPEKEKAEVSNIKNDAALLWELIDDITSSHPDAAREAAIAKTKLEECVMWAVKGITK